MSLSRKSRRARRNQKRHHCNASEEEKIVTRLELSRSIVEWVQTENTITRKHDNPIGKSH